MLRFNKMQLKTLRVNSPLRPVHTERHRHVNVNVKRSVDRQNGFATHSVRHSFRQKDQRCRPSTLRMTLGVDEPLLCEMYNKHCVSGSLRFYKTIKIMYHTR